MGTCFKTSKNIDLDIIYIQYLKGPLVRLWFCLKALKANFLN